MMVATLAAGPAIAASNVVQYTYDGAGNIVAIQRANPSPVTITGFAPGSGAPGTIVTIAGTGFSSAAASNVVTFNGTVATVTTATPGALTVAVPSTATSGKIVVAVAGNLASGAQDFIVAAPGAPTIAGFTPAAGSAGTPVTVIGSNFNPSSGATTVRLNQAAAAVSSVAATQVVFAVPPATGSGRIGVTTGAGSAVSAADFVVPPAAIAAADILATTRVVVNGPAQSLGIFAANRYGVLLFDGIAGDWLSLQFGNFAINPAGGEITYAIHRPDNTRLASGTLSATNLTVHLPQLASTGTYAVLLGTANAQVSLDARLEANRLVPADGSMLAIARAAGQSARAIITAVAGEQKALMVSELTTVPDSTNLAFSIALPSGVTFRNGAAYGLGTTSLLPAFTTSGTHPVVFTPVAATTRAAFKVGLVGGVALDAEAAALNLAIANPGDGARLNIAATAGENLGLGITGLTLNPASSAYVNLSIYKPDATLFGTGYCFTDGTQCSVNLANLPVTGSYGVIVQPANGAMGTMQVWLSHDVTGTLVSGTPIRVALPRPGQNGRLTFAGIGGAPVALQMRGLTSVPPAQTLPVLISRPGGSPLASTRLTGAGQTLVTPSLPVTGTYTVFVEPEPSTKGAATATMEVLLDPGRNLVIDGPTQASTIAVAGGTARFTFDATAGQNLGFGIGSLGLTPTADATVTTYKPDGTPIGSVNCAASAATCGGNLASLSVTGTHSIVVAPANGAIGSFNITLSNDLPGTLAAGGAALPIVLDRPGRNARLSFAGVAGQSLRLGWSGVAIAGAPGNAFAFVYGPSGTTLGVVQIASGVAAGYDLAALPATGTYTVFIDPPAGATMNATLTLATR